MPSRILVEEVLRLDLLHDLTIDPIADAAEPIADDSRDKRVDGQRNVPLSDPRRADSPGFVPTPPYIAGLVPFL